MDKEKMRKYFIVAMSALVFLVAIVAAMVATFDSDRNVAIRKATKVASQTDGMAAPMMNSLGTSAKGLSGNVGARNMAVSNDMMMESAVAPGSLAGMESQKKEIKNGNLSLRVGSADKAAEKIAQIAKDNGGEVFSSNFHQTDKNIKSGNVEVRVPVANFEKTFSDLKGVATLVIRESTSGVDVTMQYSDMQAQIKNKQAEEQSYLEILKQAGKISDVLEVTQQLAQTRGEIESLQGQIRFMDSQTDMAAISIALTEDTTVAFSEKWRPLQVVSETVNMLFKDMQGFVDFVIVLVIRIIPIMAFYGLLAFLAYWGIKKFFFRNKA